MANLRTLGTDLSAVTFTNSIADATGYPAANLNTYVKGDLWKSGATTGSQYLSLDFGTDVRLRNSLCIRNHNLIGIMSAGVIRIDSATNAAFSSGLVTLVADLNVNQDPIYQNFGGATNQRYWRILFLGTLTAAPQIGNFFIDEEFDFGNPYDIGFKMGNMVYETTKEPALSGLLRTAQRHDGRRRFEVSFDKPGVDDTVKANFREFFERVRGPLRPFYLIDDDNTVYYVHFEIDEDPLQHRFYNLNSLKGLSMVAQEVG